ncbi:Uncharacterised protein [Chlamydia trachomatis]|nr:Uncharacterised protein [Chlamydia trachomatis]
MSVRDRGSGAGAGDQALVLAYPNAAPWHTRRGEAPLLPKDRQEEKTPARCRRFKEGGAGFADVLPVTRVPVPRVPGLHAAPAVDGHEVDAQFYIMQSVGPLQWRGYWLGWKGGSQNL